MPFRLDDLNAEQREAATHRGGPLLILAGAGTGKTRTLTARVAWLLSEGAAASEILAVTFTNKAARELKERIAGMVRPEAARAVTACTFHAFCLRVLRRDAVRLGYKDTFTVLDESDQLGLVRKLVAKCAGRGEKADPAAFRALISRAKNTGRVEELEKEDTLVGEICRRYTRELRTLHAMDFDDLLLQAVRLLKEHEEARAHWRARARHLLVDEFQDTNRVQLHLVRLLAEGSQPDVCVVGDDDQSIYGWRGAEVSNILEFERHFPHPRIIRLERNYRSTASILEAANRLIRHNPRRRDKKLISHAGSGEAVRFLAAPGEREEAELIVGEIEEARAGGRRQWQDFAILFRTNAQSRPFEDHLRARRIPYRVIGGMSFYDRREIKDTTAHMAVLAHPGNDPALLRVLNAAPRGIGPSAIERALAWSAERRLSLFEALGEPGFLEGCSRKLADACRAFCTEVRERQRQAGSAPGEALCGWLEESGYFAELRRSCRTPEEADNREENVRQLLRGLEEHARGGASLLSFLDAMMLDRERAEERNEQVQGVTLITFHAAKGLEFPVVYLAGAEDGLVPHARSKDEGTLDEERRLFYVGITRAMRRLTITWCRQRMRYGSPAACRPSPFLREIQGDGVVEESYERLVNRPLTEEEIRARFAALRASLAGNGG